MNDRGTRTPLARATGLGSARSGVEHWWAERVSAIALIPLSLWLVASLVSLSWSDYTSFLAWMRTPAAVMLTIMLLIVLFRHTALGLQVVIEDYVHSGWKLAAVIAVHLGCFALAVGGIVAVLEIAFSG